MEQVINFDSLEQFLIFFSKKKCYLLSGCEGAEGQCYLSKIDGNIYKIINKFDVNGKPMNNYDIKKIITTKDIDLIHYILPQELYVINGQLIGYKTKYIKDDIFLRGFPTMETCEKIRNLDEKTLLSAYFRILRDTDKLSEAGIKINDLPYNLLFNGENYYGIDTCGYHCTGEDVFKYNQATLEEAIKENFYQIMNFCDFSMYQVADELWEESNMEIYTKKLVKLIKKSNN